MLTRVRFPSSPMARFSSRLTRLREARDAGYTTETVVVIALLVAAAIIIVGILAAKVTEKATSINLGHSVGPLSPNPTSLHLEVGTCHERPSNL